jgi:hypothetical protein
MRTPLALPSFVLPLCLLVLLLGVSVIYPGASSQGQGGVTPAQLAAALDAQKQADAKLTRVEREEIARSKWSSRSSAGRRELVCHGQRHAMRMSRRTNGEVNTMPTLLSAAVR